MEFRKYKERSKKVFTPLTVWFPDRLKAKEIVSFMGYHRLGSHSDIVINPCDICTNAHGEGGLVLRYNQVDYGRSGFDITIGETVVNVCQECLECKGKLFTQKYVI